ncbi:tail fiber assembly protein [Morganella psychrotolerans]|uniref:tail fiber assembly protein n=1 Tax=Morganella psychrotolerans TaxID=368603 RepID=UPI0039B0CD04
METNIIEQRFFKDAENTVFCLDIMPMNQDSWQSETQDGWQEISKKEADKIRNPPLTKGQLIEQAEVKKQFLIAEVTAETEMLRTKLALGRIKEDEKALLNAWLDYLDELEAVDVSTAPDIIWPVKPVA